MFVWRTCFKLLVYYSVLFAVTDACYIFLETFLLIFLSCFGATVRCSFFCFIIVVTELGQNCNTVNRCFLLDGTYEQDVYF